MRIDGWAQSFDIRRRSFCLLMARESPTGNPVPLLVLRADPDEREALLSIGRPFFASRAGRGRPETLRNRLNNPQGITDTCSPAPGG